MKNTSTITLQDGGGIGIFYLKKIWNYYSHLREPNLNAEEVEWKYINGVFNVLGIGIEPTIQYLTQVAPSFEEFENWIRKNGRVSVEIIDHFNSIINKKRQKVLMLKKNH